MYTLDIETRPKNGGDAGCVALEPWRVRQGLAEISSVAICGEGYGTRQIIRDKCDDFDDALLTLLEDLAGEVVYAQYALFDIAFLIATLQPERTGPIPPCIKNIIWRDTKLIAKWLVNGQLADNIKFSLSLANLVKTFLPDDPDTAAFVEMKSQPFQAGQNEEYWNERGLWDVIFTYKLAELFQAKLPAEQRTGFITECQCMVSVANSWIIGIRIDQQLLSVLGPKLQLQQKEMLDSIGLVPSIISSPKQLGNLLFNTWNLIPHSNTPTGTPSTGKDDLIWIQYKLLNAGEEELAHKMGIILEAKTIGTLISKYIKTMGEALAHTKDGYIYGSPTLFGTYTGRMTYSNATMKVYKTGIALHQIPRKAKDIRAMLLPPPGFKLYEADAAGQESRLMALRSKDPVMLKIFHDNLNFHSATGASIISTEYEDFEIARKAEGDDGGYYTEQRQLGKLTNLSCNYRIGGKSLSEKSFVNYDTFMDVRTGMHLVNTFNRTYEGVPKYWDDVVTESIAKGYTEEFGGRRYKLTDWSSNRWGTESSAINVPIQGAGASMKEIMIKETYEKVPEALFLLDLHDANFMLVPEDRADEIAKKLDYVLDNIQYEQYWGFEPEIPLPYESKMGVNFSEVK